jgi:hypothetical protein
MERTRKFRFWQTTHLEMESPGSHLFNFYYKWWSKKTAESIYWAKTCYAISWGLPWSNPVYLFSENVAWTGYFNSKKVSKRTVFFNLSHLVRVFLFQCSSCSLARVSSKFFSAQKQPLAKELNENKGCSASSALSLKLKCSCLQLCYSYGTVLMVRIRYDSFAEQTFHWSWSSTRPRHWSMWCLLLFYHGFT